METEIRKLQLTIMIVVDEIVRICEKYEIPYYIIGGSLLGAVRHKGFIPWDDDFDIAMKRKDYERFLEVCKIEIDPQKYFLQTEFSEELYAFSFAKFRLLGTQMIEPFSQGIDICNGIFVDIFPVDNIPDNRLLKKIHVTISHILKNMIWVKCGYGAYTHRHKLSYKVLDFIGRFFSLNRLKLFRYEWLVKYNQKKTEKCFTADYPDEVMLNRYYENRCTYLFEGRTLYGFRESKSYLIQLYGNYMELPPEEKRHWHNHGFDLGIYA